MISEASTLARNASINPNRFRSLDGIRGIAAMAVALFHFSALMNLRIVPAGYLAVDVFFVMSGFALYKSYAHRLGDRAQFRSFILGRLVRLYPLYALGLAIGVLVKLIVDGANEADLLPSFAMNLFMLPTLFATKNGMLFPFNGAMWSLCYEVAASALFGLLISKARQWHLKVLSIISGIALAGMGSVPWHGLDLGYILSRSSVTGGILRVTFSFTVGMMIARHEPRRRSVSLQSILCLFVTAVFLLIPGSRYLGCVRDVSVVLLGFPLLVIVASRVEPPATLKPAFELLGDISFPLYAIHAPLVVLWTTMTKGLALSIVANCFAYIVTMCLIAVLTEKFYDQPIRRVLSSTLKLRESAPPQLQELQ